MGTPFLNKTGAVVGFGARRLLIGLIAQNVPAHARTKFLALDAGCGLNIWADFGWRSAISVDPIPHARGRYGSAFRAYWELSSEGTSAPGNIDGTHKSGNRCYLFHALM
jgi:hypothetical protein